MDKKTTITPIIQWHEGMMLSPQHFQQMDLRGDQILSYHLQALSPYHWGVQSIKFDPIVLPEGIARVVQLEAVMPSGMIVAYGEDDQKTHSLELNVLSLKEQLKQGGQTTIYLCIPDEIPGVSPVTGEWPRYDSVDGGDVQDQNIKDNVIRIPRLVPRLSLVSASAPPPKYESIPILKMGYQDESFTNLTYQPPCLNIAPTSSIGSQCTQIAARIREKAAYLSEKWLNQVGSTLLSETANTMRPLFESLPPFEAVAHSSFKHPYQLYMSLCHLVGKLSTLRLGQVPPVFPKYDHSNLLSVFTPLMDMANVLLTSIEQNYIVIPFIPRERFFHMRLRRPYMKDALLIGIKAGSKMSEAELGEWIHDAVIASDSAVESAVTKRITGAARQILTREELVDIMPSRGVLIMSVELDPEFIKPDENLNIFNAADTVDKRPSDIFMYLKQDPQAGTSDGNVPSQNSNKSPSNGGAS